MNNIEKLAIEHGAEVDTLGINVCMSIKQLEAFAKALQQQTEPVKCMVCGHGTLYCDECGTGIYSPQKQQQSEPVAICHKNESGQLSLRKPNGEYFDMSQHIGQMFYTAPPNTVPELEYKKLLEGLNSAIKAHDYMEGTPTYKELMANANKAKAEAEGK